MTVDVWVENHQPVPLAPLADLGLVKGSLVYIGRRVSRVGGEHAAPGWVVYDGQDGFTSIETPGDFWYDSSLNWGASLGRTLQPGEALHVRFGA